MALIIRPFGQPDEHLLSRNIAVPPRMQGQIIARALSEEERGRNRWLIAKLKEKHFGKKERPHAL
ncbi:hypothetical protein [Shewanella baltica]|uniref:hypothetical protein n=1 Tax=Shewanella baltica TaxID=62322 RepID=UPI0002185AF0|nr:hypothetical protein [Shewanella baltica]AEH13136.1 hypothetical protein Sbal117_1374 [Shewanella baltica OS117]